jgi:hypothetical protein
MATTIPLKLKRAQIDGGAGTAARVVDFDTDTIKCGIWSAGAGAPSVTSSGVQFVADITTADATSVEMSATGYARQTLAGLTVAFSGSTVTWTFSNITFSQNASGFTTGRYAVIFKDAGGADSANPIIAICDLGSNQSVVAGDLILQAPAGGLIVWS